MEESFSALAGRVLQEILEQQDENGSTLSISGETVLYGPDGHLDSVGLVSFIVALEEAVEEDYGVSLDLTDEKAFSQERSPFRTLGSLADYIAGQLAAAPA